jgi:hypothetical protein
MVTAQQLAQMVNIGLPEKEIKYVIAPLMEADAKQ